MNLILWRHAEAEEGYPDMDRKLTEKGHAQAKQVGQWLLARLPEATRILVSPAHRTQQTAKALDRKFTTIAELAPGAEATVLLAAAGWPDGSNTVLIVGHQPTLGRLVRFLLCGEEGDFSIKKGQAIWLSNRQRAGQAEVTLNAAITPDLAR